MLHLLLLCTCLPCNHKLLFLCTGLVPNLSTPDPTIPTPVSGLTTAGSDASLSESVSHDGAFQVITQEEITKSIKAYDSSSMPQTTIDVPKCVVCRIGVNIIYRLLLCWIFSPFFLCKIMTFFLVLIRRKIFVFSKNIHLLNLLIWNNCHSYCFPASLFAFLLIPATVSFIHSSTSVIAVIY